MMLDNFTLECFLALVKTGSFTGASKEVYRTQSAISQQIGKLESALGKVLFVRGKNLTLTAEGEIFYDYAKQIYHLQKQVIEKVKKQDIEGELRFGLPEDFTHSFLEDVLEDFISIHPNLLINIESGLSLDLFDSFNKHKFDMILLKVNSPKDLPNSLEVWSEKLQWVSNKFVKLELEEIIPLVLAPKPCLYRFRALESLEESSLKWRISFTSSSYASRVAAVKAGLGITVLPESIIPPQFKIIQDSRLPKLSDTHIALLKHDQLNPAINSFEDFILKKLKH